MTIIVEFMLLALLDSGPDLETYITVLSEQQNVRLEEIQNCCKSDVAKYLLKQFYMALFQAVDTKTA